MVCHFINPHKSYSPLGSHDIEINQSIPAKLQIQVLKTKTNLKNQARIRQAKVKNT